MKTKNDPHDPLLPDQGHADPHFIAYGDGSTGHHPNQEFIDNTEQPEADEALEKKKDDARE